MKDVIKNKVLKLLDSGTIYLGLANKWVSPTQGVPKKSGVTIVKNEKGPSPNRGRNGLSYIH